MHKSTLLNFAGVMFVLLLSAGCGFTYGDQHANMILEKKLKAEEDARFEYVVLSGSIVVYEPRAVRIVKGFRSNDFLDFKNFFPGHHEVAGEYCTMLPGSVIGVPKPVDGGLHVRLAWWSSRTEGYSDYPVNEENCRQGDILFISSSDYSAIVEEYRDAVKRLQVKSADDAED